MRAIFTCNEPTMEAQVRWDLVAEGLTSAWAEVAGLRMHARISTHPLPRDAPAIVLVHGIGVSGRYLLPTALRLATTCRVHVPDLPGFGLSVKPAEVLDVPALADALAAWMRVLKLPRAVLLGNSFGCQIIAELGVRHPALISRAVLQGPTMDPHARSVPRQLLRWILNSPFEPATAWTSLGAVVRQDYRDAGVRRVITTFRHALRDRIEDKLPRLDVPTLVVRGAHDPIVPQRWAEEAARLLPQGRLVVVPGAAHTMCFTSPDALARVVHPFVAAACQRVTRGAA
jgi:pimeloyl-ACP methyl ester carboxylesterase